MNLLPDVGAYVRCLQAQASEALRASQLGTIHRSRHVSHVLGARCEDGFHAGRSRHDVVHEMFPDDTLPALLTARWTESEDLALVPPHRQSAPAP